MPRPQNRIAKGSILKEDEEFCQSGYDKSMGHTYNVILKEIELCKQLKQGNHMTASF